ncbi:hypothetical protein ACFV1T_33510, partial [Streptomyces vinaceus]
MRGFLASSIGVATAAALALPLALSTPALAAPSPGAAPAPLAPPPGADPNCNPFGDNQNDVGSIRLDS